MKRPSNQCAVVAGVSFTLGYWFLLLVAALAAEQACAQQSADSAAVEERVKLLVKQLDDDSFQVREDAEKALAAIGERALDEVAAAAKSDSPEVRQRAGRILKDLRRQSIGLRHLEVSQRDELVGAVTVAVSTDGKYVYSVGWKARGINTFRRNGETGLLEHVNSLVDAEDLNGVVCLRLSPDGKSAVTASFGSKTVCLFKRDVATGALEVSHVIRSDPARGMELQFPIDAMYSLDGKFIYVLDDAAAAVVVLELGEDLKLKWVEAYTGRDGCFAGARGIAMHPDGKTVLVGSNSAGTLTVADRDPATGRLTVRQVIADQQDKVEGLAGAMSVCVSRDGKFVYTASGRFHGDNAVSAFQMGEDGKLSVIQEVANDKGELVDFLGGNDVVLSPDEKSLYASGTVSGSLACFNRDPKTGKLTYISTLRNATTGVGPELGACGIDFSPDGKFLYLALEDEGAISVFARTERKH